MYPIPPQDTPQHSHNNAEAPYLWETTSVIKEQGVFFDNQVLSSQNNYLLRNSKNYCLMANWKDQKGIAGLDYLSYPPKTELSLSLRETFVDSIMMTYSPLNSSL